jgi:hypothetical protein
LAHRLRSCCTHQRFKGMLGGLVQTFLRGQIDFPQGVRAQTVQAC